MNRSTFPNRAALWTAAGVLGAALTAGGVAQAVTSPSPSPSPGNGKAPAGAGAGAKAGHAKHHGKGQRLDRVAAHVLHGDVVVRAKDGYRTVALQRGTVVSVSSTSLVVRSPDGFAATYAVNADTFIRKGHQGSQSSQLTAGDPVLVLANRSGSTLTATKVLAHQTKAAKPVPTR